MEKLLRFVIFDLWKLCPLLTQESWRDFTVISSYSHTRKSKELHLSTSYDWLLCAQSLGYQTHNVISKMTIFEMGMQQGSLWEGRKQRMGMRRSNVKFSGGKDRKDMLGVLHQQAWEHTPLILAFGRWRQEDQKLNQPWLSCLKKRKWSVLPLSSRSNL